GGGYWGGWDPGRRALLVGARGERGRTGLLRGTRRRGSRPRDARAVPGRRHRACAPDRMARPLDVAPRLSDRPRLRLGATHDTRSSPAARPASPHNDSAHSRRGGGPEQSLGGPGAVWEADWPAMSFTASRRLTFVGLAADARTVLGVDTADVRETESARCSLNEARADTLLELTDFAADGRLRHRQMPRRGCEAP